MSQFLVFLLQARSDILKIHSRKMNLTRGINLRKIAEMMPGASGAEVKVRCHHYHGNKQLEIDHSAMNEYLAIDRWIYE